MAKSVEGYRATAQQYEGALAEYNALEAAYRELFSNNPEDPQLRPRYDELLQRKARLDELYGELTAMRSEIVRAAGA